MAHTPVGLLIYYKYIILIASALPRLVTSVTEYVSCVRCHVSGVTYIENFDDVVFDRGEEIFLANFTDL